MKKQTIKDIKEQLQFVETKEDPWFNELLKDERKGVQTAIKQWQNKQDKQQLIKDRFITMSHFEEQAMKQGYQNIAGIDEVGRGPLAGPVVAAAVILDANKPILGLNDSKKLSLLTRTQLFQEISEKAIAVGVGIIPADKIDQVNILEATKLAMSEAVNNLAQTPDYLLVDAVKLPNNIPQQFIVKGDMKSNSIAAASIIAKVTRDQMMETYDEKYPGYGFSSNVGYGTKAHLEGLKRLGATPIHRRSFSPVSNYLK